MSLRCRIGSHDLDQAQGRVGYCTRAGCDHFRRYRRQHGYFVRAQERHPERPPARAEGDGWVAPPPVFARREAGQR